MNIAQANAIPLPEILQKMNAKINKQKGTEIWYFSPLRDEKTASFKVNLVKNKWYDFGSGMYGNGVDLVVAYLQRQGEDHAVADALRWIPSMLNVWRPVVIEQTHTPVEGESAFKILSVRAVTNPTLVSYLKSRGISLEIAQNYVREVIFKSAKSGKKIFALGMQTEDEGYEVRNPAFKSCIGAKSITFVRGSQEPAKEVHVFEGMMDFLSVMEIKKAEPLTGDVIILNSVNNLHKAYPYITKYTYTTIYTWLDNDAAGEAATEHLKGFAEHEGIFAFQTLNKSYAGHKDVNEWHMKTLQP